MSLLSDNNPVMALGQKTLSMVKRSPAKVDYEPQKTRACNIRSTKDRGLVRVTPESVGVSSLYIKDFLEELNKMTCDLHHFLMLRHGKIIAQGSFAPYLKDTWHICHGIAKSITGLAIGMLIDEGKLSLETKMTEIFGSRISFLNSLKLKNITILDLLTMSSGTTFDEGQTSLGNDWRGMFFDAPLHFEPGSRFEYNSMNSYMLSAAVTAVTGLPMDEYLKDRLFDPLDINDPVWERCPAGITKGGWGLYLSPSDMAKIGLLYLNKGVYEEKRIISEKYLALSSEAHFRPFGEDGYGYGMHVWTGNKNGDVLFSGMLLQECFVFSQNDIVIVINAGSAKNNDSEVKELVNSYFGGVYNPPAFLVDNPESHRALASLLSSYSSRQIKSKRNRGGWSRKHRVSENVLSFDRLCDVINNSSYVLEKRSAGFMPAFMQYTHNNRTAGLCEVSFEKDHRGLVIRMTEGDVTNELFVSKSRDRYCVMNFRGEMYLVSGIASFAKDEDDDLCLKVEAVFIEEACKRHVKFFFKDSFKRIKIELSESPGKEILRELEGYADEPDLTDIVYGHKKNLYEDIGENVLWARP